VFHDLCPTASTERRSSHGFSARAPGSYRSCSSTATPVACYTSHYFLNSLPLCFALKWASVRHTCATAFHTSHPGKLDTVWYQLTANVTRSKHRICTLSLANAPFLTQFHMHGTLFQLTFNLHPVYILLSDFLNSSLL
jgi:hypothetical protein